MVLFRIHSSRCPIIPHTCCTLVLNKVLILHDSAPGEKYIHMLLSKSLLVVIVLFSNCVPFGIDNANEMMGKHKCVYAFLKKDHEDIHIVVAVICCTMLLSVAANV